MINIEIQNDIEKKYLCTDPRKLNIDLDQDEPIYSRGKKNENSLLLINELYEICFENIPQIL